MKNLMFFVLFIWFLKVFIAFSNLFKPRNTTCLCSCIYLSSCTRFIAYCQCDNLFHLLASNRIFNSFLKLMYQKSLKNEHYIFYQYHYIILIFGIFLIIFLLVLKENCCVMKILKICNLIIFADIKEFLMYFTDYNRN